jgi:hypothetical protein
MSEYSKKQRLIESVRMEPREIEQVARELARIHCDERSVYPFKTVLRGDGRAPAAAALQHVFKMAADRSPSHNLGLEVDVMHYDQLRTSGGAFHDGGEVIAYDDTALALFISADGGMSEPDLTGAVHVIATAANRTLEMAKETNPNIPHELMWQVDPSS